MLDSDVVKGLSLIILFVGSLVWFAKKITFVDTEKKDDD